MKLLLPGGIPYRQVHSFSVDVQFLIQERRLKRQVNQDLVIKMRFQALSVKEVKEASLIVSV